MTKEELIGGIKNALERGESMDKAIKSFIGAGYNREEVTAAARDVSRGVSAIIQPQGKAAPEAGQQKELPKIPGKKKSKAKTIIIVAIIIFLLILVGILVLTFLFPVFS